MCVCFFFLIGRLLTFSLFAAAFAAAFALLAVVGGAWRRDD